MYASLPNFSSCVLGKQAALRLGERRVIGQKDLVEAAEAEKAHSRDEVNEIMLRAFLWSFIDMQAKWQRFLHYWLVPVNKIPHSNGGKLWAFSLKNVVRRRPINRKDDRMNCLYMFWLRKFSCSWLMMAKKMNNALTLELGIFSLMTLWSLLSKLHVQLLVTYIWWFVLTGPGIKSLYLTREFCLNLCKNKSWTRPSSQMGQSLLTTKRGPWNRCNYCLGHTHTQSLDQGSLENIL